MSHITAGSIRTQYADRERAASARRVEASAPSVGLSYVASLYGVEASEMTATDTSRDVDGNPIAPLEAVQIVNGTPPEQWSREQIESAHLWALGPRFRAGLQPPPGSTEIFIPSPNSHSYFDEARGQWVEKRPYREVSK